MKRERIPVVSMKSGIVVWITTALSAHKYIFLLLDPKRLPAFVSTLLRMMKQLASMNLLQRPVGSARRRM